MRRREEGVFTYMAQRKRLEVALQVVVAAHRAVLGDDQQLLVLRPAEALDAALVPLRASACLLRWSPDAPYVDAADQLAGTAVDFDARLGHAGPAVRVQLVLIAVDCCVGSGCAYATVDFGVVPTYCAAVRSPHHIVVLELEVLVEHGRVQLDLAVELVADLLPVGGWLRHGYRTVMACGRGSKRCGVDAREVRSSSVLKLAAAATPPALVPLYLHSWHVARHHYSIH